MTIADNSAEEKESRRAVYSECLPEVQMEMPEPLVSDDPSGQTTGTPWLYGCCWCGLRRQLPLWPKSGECGRDAEGVAHCEKTSPRETHLLPDGPSPPRIDIRGNKNASSNVNTSKDRKKDESDTDKSGNKQLAVSTAGPVQKVRMLQQQQPERTTESQPRRRVNCCGFDTSTQKVRKQQHRQQQDCTTESQPRRKEQRSVSDALTPPSGLCGWVLSPCAWLHASSEFEEKLNDSGPEGDDSACRESKKDSLWHDVSFQTVSGVRRRTLRRVRDEERHVWMEYQELTLLDNSRRFQWVEVVDNGGALAV
ncbi:hypothetical protein, conserved [Eimeria tenella]|uniref:Uncharacterized protein n=1 Tax=Eimeria tenella TaxID=5802 RepID=U6L684_EIMTE|nr:hypothetical protein, conserved [Eimeria tenella]CDJ43310.1 hypothetical protein, conserved [Eimeria tenella]|eukprot:XP_013234060.1 hypothetical protein, conserved [Eimeria tenella]